MALTRARVITGPAALADRIERLRERVLAQPRDADELVQAVAEMRDKMARNNPVASIWAIKHMRGGLVDVEFLAQYLLLRHAHDQPAIISRDTAEIFRQLGAHGLIDETEAEMLVDATLFWRRLQNLIRLTGDAASLDGDVATALKDLLVKTTGASDFDGLTARIRATAARVQALFQHHIVEPAEQVPVENTEC
jgi:glutamate-ammonia-ligase adenylyltransferase